MCVWFSGAFSLQITTKTLKVQYVRLLLKTYKNDSSDMLTSVFCVILSQCLLKLACLPANLAQSSHASSINTLPVPQAPVLDC